MTQDPLPVVVAADDESREIVAARSGSQTLLRVSSRLGVWGFVGGFGPITAFTFGAPISLGLAITLMGVGLLVSGLGTVTASFLAYRRVADGGGLVKAASLVGVPLGASLAVLGLTSLFQWPALVSIVNAITPTAAVLGAVVIAMLVVGFVIEWSRGDDEEADSL